MILKFILFIGIVLGILFVAHILSCIIIVRLLGITSPIPKTALFTSLSLLSLSFVASFLLLHWWENLLTSSFYIFSAIWVGLFLNFWLVIVLSYLFIWTAKLMGYTPNTQVVAMASFGLIILYSAYGVYNASHPRIKNMEVEIENLPEKWKNKTIVQVSDVHLGHLHRVGFMERIVEKVNSLNPDLIFITGDLFDGMGRKFIRFVEPLKKLKAQKGIFFITGNHETYVGVSRVLGILERTKINVLDNEIVEIDGLQVVGVSYPGLGGKKDVQSLKGFEGNFSKEKPTILLFHTPTSITQEKDLKFHARTFWTPDTSFAMSKEMGVDLQLSGHTHAGQLFPFGYLTKLIYKGYDYGLHNEGGFHIYVTCGVGTWGPPMRTGNSPEIVLIRLR